MRLHFELHIGDNWKVTNFRLYRKTITKAVKNDNITWWYWRRVLSRSKQRA